MGGMVPPKWVHIREITPPGMIGYAVARTMNPGAGLGACWRWWRTSRRWYGCRGASKNMD